MRCLVTNCIDWPCRLGEECAFHNSEEPKQLTDTTHFGPIIIEFEIEEVDVK